MASRRKKRKAEAENADPLGGFSLDELLGLDPITDGEKKPGVVGKAVALPFKAVGGLIKAPFKIAKGVLGLPVKVVRAARPSKRKDD